MNDEKIDDMVARLLRLYTSLGEKARLSRATQGALLGVSGSRFSQLTKNPSGRIATSVFLKLRAGCYAIQHALDNGDLPAKAERGKPQADALERLTEYTQSM